MAAAYAGAVYAPAFQALRVAANGHQAALAQGVVFAAQARKRAGNPVPHTEIACRVMVRRSWAGAAALARQCLPEGHELQAYQDWRAAIQACCAQGLPVSGGA